MSSLIARSALLTLLLLTPGALVAQEDVIKISEPTRFRLILNGAFDLGSLSFSDSRTFELFQEDARFDARYGASSGVGFDGGLQFDITPVFGVMAAFSATDRDADASFSASLPHPLFFNQPRDVSGDIGALSYKEQSIHVSLTLSGSAGKLDFTGFGGVTFFDVEAELVADVNFDQIYPFDTVTLTGTARTSAEDSPTGFHVGGRIDFRISRNVGLGAQLRFSRATARLGVVEGASVDVDAGGARAAAGLRIYF